MHTTGFTPFRWPLIECIMIYYMLAFSLAQVADPEPRTALSVKTLKQVNRKPPGMQADDFKTLLKMNNAFIDKSLLIKAILQHKDKVIVITRPRKWGKSTNLHMLRLFLMHEMDKDDEVKPTNKVKNYYFFTKGEISEDRVEDKLKQPLLIAREKSLVKDYLCQYPIIHIRFTHLRGHDFDSLLKQLRRAIRIAFTEHRYMSDVFNDVIFDNTSTNCRKAKMEKNFNLFRKYLANERTDLHKTMHCIEFLSRVLWEHFHKPAFLLMDDYDAPVRLAILNKTFVSSDKPKFFTFYEKFLRYSFSSNRFIKKGILTGLMTLKYLQNFTHTIHDVEDPFHEFYGFNEREVTWLFDHYAIGKEAREKALERYQSIPNSSLRLYNPWSIHNFIYEKKIKNYWLEQDQSISYLKPLLKNNEFREAFTRLVYNNELIVDPKDLQFSIDDYMHLQNFMKERIKENISDTAIAFLHTHGYLASTYLNDESVLLQFPNREIGIEMRNELVRYYRAQLGIVDADKVKNEIEKFKKFIKREHRNGKILAEIIKRIIRFRPHRLDEGKIHAILNFLAVYVDSYRKIQAEVSNDTVPDIVFMKPGRCVIIKFTVKASSPRTAWYRATTFKHLASSNNTKMVYIGVNVASTTTVQVRMEAVRNSSVGNISSEEPMSVEQRPTNIKKRKRFGRRPTPTRGGDETESDGDEPFIDEYEPMSDGDEPKSEGDEPESEGDEPESEGDEPESEGDEPENEGDEPESEGDEPEYEGDEPESEGDEPESEGDEPESDGDEPNGDEDASNENNSNSVPS